MLLSPSEFRWIELVNFSFRPQACASWTPYEYALRALYPIVFEGEVVDMTTSTGQDMSSSHLVQQINSQFAFSVLLIRFVEWMNSVSTLAKFPQSAFGGGGPLELLICFLSATNAFELHGLQPRLTMLKNRDGSVEIMLASVKEGVNVYTDIVDRCVVAGTIQMLARTKLPV
jgi:hypothetical protein